MAQKQIAARIQGDDFQARYFWYQAALLLIPGAGVAEVKLENAEAPHVDDVTVHFEPPGRRDQGVNSLVDYYQVKFHVDQGNAYCADGLMDPSVIGSKTKSLLQRFYATYMELRDTYSFFTLGLVSNWTWNGDDRVATSIRHSGALPDNFCTSGKRSALGKVRERWQAHVEAEDDAFVDFAARLRLKLNYFGYGDLNQALNDRLRLAGLVPIDLSRSGSPYDELARKFIVDGETEFDAGSLRSACEREGLVAQAEPEQRPRRIGYRTFVPFAELLESETDAFVCGADLFDGRHPRHHSTWAELYQRFAAFTDQQRPGLATSHHVLLDCHASAALAAGYLLTTRASVAPVGPRPALCPQVASTTGSPPDEALWRQSVVSVGDGEEVAVAVSVTHCTGADVTAFVAQAGLPISTLIELEPAGGHGLRSVESADHAVALVDDLVRLIRGAAGTAPVKHLFIAAPNFLTFFLGQRLRALGQVKTYEFDFDGPEPRQYRLALELPMPPNEAHEVRDDTEN